MHRNLILNLLQDYNDPLPHQQRCKKEIIGFIHNHPACFERSLASGHVTGSAWLLSANKEKVLLTHHRALNQWFQLGGHADGDGDILGVALKEAREESGIEEIMPLSSFIFDLDIHEVPKIANTAAHYHYDIRFILKTKDNDDFKISSESLSLQWFLPAELSDLTRDPSMLRMAEKWQRFFL